MEIALPGPVKAKYQATTSIPKGWIGLEGHATDGLKTVLYSELMGPTRELIVEVAVTLRALSKNTRKDQKRGEREGVEVKTMTKGMMLEQLGIGN